MSKHKHKQHKKTSNTRVSQRLDRTPDNITFSASGNCEFENYRCKTKSLREASQEQVFSTCYRDVTALVFKQKIHLKSVNGRQTQDLKAMLSFLDAIDIKLLCKQIYQNEFLGSGWGLLRIVSSTTKDTTSPINVQYIPSHYAGRTILTKNWNPNTNSVKSVTYYTPDNKNEIINLDEQNILLSLYGTDLSERSILGQVYDLIDLKFAIQESMLRLASRNNQPVSFINPDYSSFPKTGSVDQDIKSLAELLEESKNVKANFRSINAKTNLVFSTVPLALNVVGIDEVRARGLEKLKWIDSQIYLATGLNGTFLETNNSNRASAEQGMDNVLLTTIRFWTDKFIGIHEKIINAVAPNTLSAGKYYFTSDVILTAEQLEADRVANEIEKKNIAKMQLILKLANTEYKIDRASVAETLELLGLKLQDEQPILTPPPELNNSDNPEDVTDNQTNPEQQRNIRVTEEDLPKTSYFNISESKIVKDIISEITTSLNTFYTKVFEADEPNTELIDNINQFLTREELDKYSQVLKEEAVKDWNSSRNSKVKANKKVEQRVQQALDMHFTGKDEYGGFADTVTKELKGVIEGATDENIQDYYQSRINTLTQNTAKRIEDGLFVNLYYSVSEQLAINTKQDFVGAITVGDENVRESHRKNERTFWKLGSTAPSGTPTPWLDYGDRCSYFYNSAQELSKAGFKPFK